MKKQPIIDDELENCTFPPLARLVLTALDLHPMGMSEYELIQWLRKNGYDDFQNVSFLDRLSLFQTHFILFHTLYQLSDLLWQRKWRLDIDALKIMLLPANATDNADLAKSSHLRDYYLDLRHLENTTDNDVADLLQSFWQRMASPDQRAAALAELELTDPVDFAVIKQQHRRLVMKYHPDRGGDKEKLQAINAAMEILKRMHNGDS